LSLLEPLNDLLATPAIKWIVFALAGLVAAVLNTLAGGGPLITLGVMVGLGVDAKTANITSTIALFPGQILTGWAARGHLKPIAGLSLPVWLSATLVGGALGGALIAITPGASFRTQVPWLVLFATGIYTWRALHQEGVKPVGSLSQYWAGPTLFVLAIYGGYFGGGNSFLVLALLSALGLGARTAGSVKNLLVALINAAAVVIFLIGGTPDLFAGSAICVGGLLGGALGGKWLANINEGALRILVIGIGVSLAIWLFIAS
jgi:uncharacterized protein